MQLIHVPTGRATTPSISSAVIDRHCNATPLAPPGSPSHCPQPPEHLQDDIDRLSHPDAAIDLGIVVHLYRLSESGKLFSGRDWSARSGRILSVEDVADLVRTKPVEVYYGLHDRTGRHENCVWLIDANGMERLDKPL